MDVISTSVTLKSSNSWRQEMDKRLPFATAAVASQSSPGALGPSDLVPCGVKPVRCPLLCRYRRGSGLEPARHGAL